VRDQVTAPRGTIMTKVLGEEAAENYFTNNTAAYGGNFKPDTVRGFVARGTDVADIDRPLALRDALALDDSASPKKWSPIPVDAEYAYQMRWQAVDHMPIGYGGRTEAVADQLGSLTGVEPFQGDDPFMGTGYTGGGVPEFKADDVEIGRRAEIWSISRDGRETLAGIFTPGTGWVDLRGSR
jgi:hypothetical protein